jgi:release factor glutamine methyltransferase
LGSACFDAIVSNPPYVPAGHLDAHPVALAFEPRFALSPGSDGLEAIRTIAVQACAHLVPGGWLLLEHGFDQAEQVQAALSALGYVEIAAHHDTAGRPRVIAGRRAASATLPQATDR